MHQLSPYTHFPLALDAMTGSLCEPIQVDYMTCLHHPIILPVISENRGNNYGVMY